MDVAGSNSAFQQGRLAILTVVFASIFLFSHSVKAADEDLTKADHLTVGSTLLTINHRDENSTEVFQKGDKEPLFEGHKSDYQEPAALVRYRLKASMGEAAVIEIHDEGDIDETRYMILVDQKTSPFQIIEFGTRSTAFGGEGHLTRTKQGFRFEQKAYSFQSGTRMEWSFATGLKTSAIAFVPSGGSTMDSFYRSKAVRKLEPLENKAFYKAVMDMPVEDQKALLVSMSGITNLNSDSSGSVNTDLYGLRKSNDTLAFSNCGLAFDGHLLSCLGKDSLAVWERKSGKFYFAVNAVSDGDARSRDDDSVHFFPEADQWSVSARSQLNDWQAGSIWADE